MEETKELLLGELQAAQDVIPEEHDATYILVPAVVKAYGGVDESALSKKDLNALLYAAYVATAQEKKDKIIDSSLLQNKKDELCVLIDKLDTQNQNEQFANSRGVNNLGMFKRPMETIDPGETGNYTAEELGAFFQGLVRIAGGVDEEEAFRIVEDFPGLEGIGVSVLSKILHCLRPKVFPIFEENSQDFYVDLGAVPEDLAVIDYAGYIAFSKRIKKFCENYTFENYRVLDILAEKYRSGSDVPLLKIWKVSHGVDSKAISAEEANVFEEKHIIVVSSGTKALGTRKLSQGEWFMKGMSQGDYFYLCYSNSIRFFCRLVDNEVLPNEEKGGNWYQRKYEVLAYSKDKTKYTGKKKMWTPNTDSTLYEVPTSEHSEFEALILKPYFGLELSKLGGLGTGDAEESENDIDLEGFAAWLLKTKEVASESVSSYKSGLCAIKRTYGKNINQEYATDQCRALLDKIANDSTISDKKKSDWSAHLRKYIKYKNISAGGSDESVEEGESAGSKETSVNAAVSQVLKKEGFLSANTIFYGVPGCGKSYHISRLLHIGKKYEVAGDALDRRFYKRILFHPEYSYSDFIGQIVPQTDGDKIKYEFRAGPFVEILNDALADTENHYFLIIEEINRGNAPAIFGDIFQLLDRDDDGKSEYPVYNRDIVTWLNGKGVDVREVSIPQNLTILATMNTSDQNVFTLDTAFKRRWRMTRIPNNFKNEQDPILGKKVAGRAYLWRDFAERLNADILKNCNDGTVAEDKLLGAHFVKQRELDDVRAFAEKIFMYLWNDVVKYNKGVLFRVADFKTLDEVIEGFVKNKNVFSERCERLSELFTEQPTEESNAEDDTIDPEQTEGDDTSTDGNHNE